MKKVKPTHHLKQDVLCGPEGEVVKVNWMPGNRLRLDFAGCGPGMVTKIFPSPSTDITHIEIQYGK
jgi:hypothetical protein